MSKTITVNDTSKTLTIISDVDLPVSGGFVQNVLKALEVFCGKYPCTRFQIIQDATNPDLYSYRVDAKDGRIWTQSVKFIDGEPCVTYSVKDYWKLDEAMACRPIREELLIPNLKPLKLLKVQCVWN